MFDVGNKVLNEYVREETARKNTWRRNALGWEIENLCRCQFKC